MLGNVLRMSDAETVTIWATPVLFEPCWERSHPRQAAVSRQDPTVAPGSDQQCRLAKNKPHPYLISSACTEAAIWKSLRLYLMVDGKLKISRLQKALMSDFHSSLGLYLTTSDISLAFFNFKTAPLSFLEECFYLLHCCLPSTLECLPPSSCLISKG